jgi:diguanylate cyclase (GGDEF)-like protein
VTTSARIANGADRIRSYLDRVRLNLLATIGIFVAVAIICVVLAVLSSSQRANNMSLAREQSLIRHAIIDQGSRVLRETESVSTRQSAIKAIAVAYDEAWVEQWVGHWLKTLFSHDVIMVIDAGDHVQYVTARDGHDAAAEDLRTAVRTGDALVRKGQDTAPDGAIAIETGAGATPNGGHSAAWMQQFNGQPAIVAAVAIGSEADLANGAARAPLVMAVKYLGTDTLRKIGDSLQLTGLRSVAVEPDGGERQSLEFTDTAGQTVGRLSWIPAQPGRAVATSVLPFIGLALLAFVALAGLVLHHMQRTTRAIAAGETRLRHLALHDPICGLPNRIYFSERLAAVIGQVRRGGPTAAVFYIDLDHFKDVNDTLGHHVGDELILHVTQRLSRVVRGDDVVARLGGDEFAIVTVCESDSYSLQAIAGRIIAAVCAPYGINGHNIMIGASIGIAVIDRRARDATDIMRYADMALYRAKNEGRNRACVYDAAMDADLSRRKLLEGDLLEALRNDGLHAVYQPIVNAAGETMIGVEALARWTHPTQGIISPADFIPIAEHAGLIVELGEWILRRACLDGRNWPGLTVAVNVSPLQFRRSDFVDMVERVLEETGFDASRLELEITESTLIGNQEAAELSMLRLKAIGVRLALDDFGTGYSSLLYLRRFPFDKLKIDSSFVHSIETAPDAAAIVHAIVSLGRGLGMRVTAEGVENAEQHLFLRAAGVHSMQGYRFGRPGVAGDVTERLKAPDNYGVGNPDVEVALAS